MSAGYAARLKEYPNKGVCGLPERLDTKRALAMKLKQLAGWIQEIRQQQQQQNISATNKDAKGGIVIFTGAGISTSAGIPDFRGPNGIWTQEIVAEKKKKRKKTDDDDGNQQEELQPTN